MKPVIISYDCVDHDPIDMWVPEDPDNVDFWMNFNIGLDGSSAGDNFQVHILTIHEARKSKSTKHVIVLPTYSWEQVLVEVDKILDQCQGDGWADISEKLSGFMQWEYENYKA